MLAPMQKPGPKGWVWWIAAVIGGLAFLTMAFDFGRWALGLW
jgi:hypothetical protein